MTRLTMRCFLTRRFFATGLLLLALPLSAEARMPTVERVVTPGGLTGLLVSTPQPKMVDVALNFRCGHVFDPDGKEGLATLLAALFDESVAGMDTATFHEKLDDIGAGVSGAANEQHIRVLLRTLSSQVEPAFALFGKAVTRPDLREADTTRMRDALLQAHREGLTRAGARAARALSRQVFGDHPYSKAQRTTLAGLGSLTAADARALHTRCLTKSNSFFTAIGDIDAPTLSRLLDAAVGNLPQGDGPWQLADLTTPPAPMVMREELPVPQSVIMMGHLLDVPRDHPDFWPLHVANHIFGDGGFESRLTKLVREQHGLAYSISSGFAPLKGRGYFSVQTAVKNADVEKTRALIQQELHRLVRDGVTDEELTAAQAYMAGAFPIRLGTNSTILAFLQLMASENLPLDYMETRVGKILAVTKADINRALRRHIKPDLMSVVIVGGDPAP
jgi:zinc protease